MGIFDWLFRNEPNEDIEKKRRRKERIKKSLEEFKENKKIEENEKAEYEAFLNENRRVLCDDGVERLFFFNRDKFIEDHITTLKVNKITVERDKSIYSVHSQERTLDNGYIDVLETKKNSGRPFESSIEVKKWFNKKGGTLNKDEILLYKQAMVDEANERRRSSGIKWNYSFLEQPQKLVIINDYAFEVDRKYTHSSRMLSLFSGSIDETTYKNGESKSKNKKGPNVDQLNQVINDLLLDLISFDLVEDKKLKIKNKESGERVGFFIEEIVYDSYNEIVYRSGHQVCDDDEWNQVENTDELITFFIDKDGKFVDSPENYQEVITSYNNGTYCMSELNKVFLEHSKQYKINDTEVYNKRHILKVLKDIKE